MVHGSSGTLPHITLQGRMQQSHSVSPQSQPKHGFLTPFTPPLIEVDDDDEDVGRVLFTGSPSCEAAIAIVSG